MVWCVQLADKICKEALPLNFKLPDIFFLLYLVEHR